ncbi:MAG: hypothetical protein ACXAC7_06410 [Candidatus Hodarchaeales archaeon]
MAEAEEIKSQLLTIREIVEKFFIETTGEKSFEGAVNILNREYEVIENSLSTLLNFIALQQNVIRSFQNIEQFTRVSALDEKTYDQLIKTLRVIMIPQFEVMISNLSAVHNAGERVILYTDNPDLPGGISEKIREINDLDKKFLEIIDFNKEITSSSLDIALKAMIMARFEEAKKNIDSMLNNVNKLIYKDD